MNPGSLIINLAPTGMVPTKEMTPHVPVSTEEILGQLVTADAGQGPRPVTGISATKSARSPRGPRCAAGSAFDGVDR